MSDDSEKSTKTALAKRAVQAGAALTGALVGAEAAGPLGAAGGALAGASLDKALDALGGLVFAYRKERRRLWLDRALRTKAGEQLQDAIRGELPDPRLVANIAESITAVDQAIADSAVPALAELLGQYQGPPPQPDWYFRGMNRVLRDVSEEEVHSLRALIAALASLRITWPLLTVTEHLEDGELIVLYLDAASNLEEERWVPVGASDVCFTC
ncbi:MAG TPA: hypothetical protein VK459_15065 [Polyangiaceae bacterium]|nr:hypothetical protein [Polyangiaceae bacterium]